MKNFYNYEWNWLKNENLIKEDDLVDLESIKKLYEKSNDIVLNKLTIERYLKKEIHLQNAFGKHEYTLKKNWQIIVLKGIY